MSLRSLGPQPTTGCPLSAPRWRLSVLRADVHSGLWGSVRVEGAWFVTKIVTRGLTHCGAVPAEHGSRSLKSPSQSLMLRRPKPCRRRRQSNATIAGESSEGNGTWSMGKSWGPPRAAPRLGSAPPCVVPGRPEESHSEPWREGSIAVSYLRTRRRATVPSSWGSRHPTYPRSEERGAWTSSTTFDENVIGVRSQ
jgi:hypothetical protein